MNVRRFALALCLLAGCADDGTGDPAVADTGEGSGARTTSSDKTAHDEARSVASHVEGGAAPFALDDHAQWELYGASAVAAVEAGRMPPWSPNPDCVPFADARLMPESEVAALRAWVDDGAPVGDPALAIIDVDTTAATFAATHGATIPAFTPDLTDADAYRCFVLDVDVPETVYMTASRILPGNELVHHALAFALEGAQLQTARDLDALDDTPGYPCFGGPIPLGDFDDDASPSEALASFSGFPTQIGGWVPGAGVAEGTPGSATRITAGSAVVLQIHYSAVAGDAQVDDATRFEMIATNERPDFLRVTAPIAVTSLDIPADQVGVAHSVELPYYADDALVIRSLAGHMHLLGTEIRAEVIGDAGERCLFDIPEWDFNWQQQYILAQDDWQRLEPGERVRTTCVYDNSAANQPIVNGERLDPVDVAWGDGTLDEMCLLYVEAIFPYSEPDDAGGDGVCPITCVDDCRDTPTTECLLRCSDDNLACVGCAFEELATCGAAPCLAALELDPPPCIETCFNATVMLHGDTAMCLAAECPDTWASLTACLDPLFVDAACAAPLSACGLTE